MSRRLTGNVAKRDPRTGQVRVFLAGTEVPDDSADWFSQPAEPSQPATPTTSNAPASDEPPPRGGEGSGREAWAAYAEGKVDVADLSRDEIIDALEADGHIDKQ